MGTWRTKLDDRRASKVEGDFKLLKWSAGLESTVVLTGFIKSGLQIRSLRQT